MTFFYDLNKRLAQLASKQDAKQISEDAKAVAPKSKLAESMDVAEAGYSAKAARAGKDIGKPGKAFSKIAKGAAERYGSKAAGERVAGAVLNKLRHPKEDTEMDESAFQAAIGKKKYGEKGMKALQKAGREHASDKTMSTIRNKYDKYDESQGMTDEGNAFTGALAKTPKGGKFKVGNKEFTDTSSLEEGTCPSCACAPCKCNEGNAFTGALAKTPKGGKFKVGGKEFKDTSDLEEGFKEMDAWLASREKEKGTGKFDRKERTLPGGMKATTYTRKHEDDVDSDEETTSSEPKRRGRPKGKDKGPERVTAKSYKYKAGRPTKTKEDLDSDGVMMTRPTNCSSESIEHGEQAEYNDEAGQTKDSLHTIVRSAKELESALRSNENLPEWVQEKIGQIKGMMSSVTDYMLSTHERDVEQRTGEEGITMEKAPPGAKAERMVKHIKKSLSKDGKLSDKDKAIAYATTWKARKAGKVEEESTDKEDTKAERAGKKVAKDIEYDEGHKGKDDNRAEKAGKKVTKDIEYDDKKDKEEKVDETTVAGSIAPAQNAAPKAGKGMQFGKGVYEGFNNSVEKMITESISVESKMQECGDGEMAPSITITADGEEAAKLMMLLKLAGLEGQVPSTCPTCEAAPCACDQIVDENSPDWPTNTEKLDADPNLRTYSGGLNGPKSTGQTTIPVVASQLRRQVSMEESVELERNLFKTWKNYKG